MLTTRNSGAPMPVVSPRPTPPRNAMFRDACTQPPSKPSTGTPAPLLGADKLVPKFDPNELAALVLSIVNGGQDLPA